MQYGSSKESNKKTWNNTKKKTLRYYEQKEEKVKEYLGKTADINKENIVYVDETGINSYLYREYAYAERGKKVYGKIKGRKFKRTNIIAAKYGKQIGVQPEAWGPMAEGKHGIFTHPVLTSIGSKYGKTAAQTALRWNIQRGVVIIPKSIHKDRMEENLDIWDFQLSDEDMAAISTLDLGHSEIIDHSLAETAKWLNGWKIHD